MPRLRLVGLVLTLLACQTVTRVGLPAATSTPLPLIALDDLSVFKAGLLPAEQARLNEFAGATRYQLDITLDDDLQHVQGHAHILYTNQETETLTELYVRLYPNFLGGASEVSQVQVNGAKAQTQFKLQDSLMIITLPEPLAVGASLTLDMDFAVTVPTDAERNYGILASVDDILTLAHFYPALAVYDQTGWNAEIPPDQGDVTYLDAAFFLVRVTAPSEQTLIASGVAIAHETNDATQTVTFAAGPMRDFYLVASDRFKTQSQTVDGVTITSYAPAEFDEASQYALDAAAEAVKIYNQRVGAYPYTELDLISTPTLALGVEYPGAVALTLEMYDLENARNGRTAALQTLDAVVAHEVGHQWFYGLIGNDQLDEPWLDESLAQYATMLYFQDRYGSEAGQGFREALEARWNRALDKDTPIGLPVSAYENGYSAIVYGRGPLFVATLAEQMGAEKFDAFLHTYFRDYEYRVATTADFKRVAEEACGCDLTNLFEEWVYKQ